MIKKRGQVSFEYLAITSFGIMILMIGVYMFYSYSIDSNDQFLNSQINSMGSNIISQIENIHYTAGVGSSVSLEINIPSNVNNIYIKNYSDQSELVIQYNLRRGENEAVFFTNVNLNATSIGDNKMSFFKDEFHTGALKLKISNIRGGVQLEEAN